MPNRPTAHPRPQGPHFSTPAPPSLMTAHTLNPVPQAPERTSPFPLISGHFDVRGSAAALMQSELERAVAAAAAQPSLLAPSFSLASALSASHRIDLTAACSRSSTPGMRSLYGSCESLSGLADANAARSPTAALGAAAPLAAAPLVMDSRLRGPRPNLSSDDLDKQVNELLKSGRASQQQRAANMGVSMHLVADQPTSPTPNVGLPPVPPADLYAEQLKHASVGQTSIGQKRARPASQGDEPTGAGAATAKEAPPSLGASPLAPPYSPLITSMPELPPLTVTLNEPVCYSNGSSPTAPRALGAAPATAYDAPAASAPQSITVLPGATSALPRIANLRASCSDGLMLLSTTAFLVARDGTSPSATSPGAAAKKQRL